MNSILAMWTPGPIELIVILIITVLIFGKRLPDIARSAGKSLSEFKKGLKEISNLEEKDDTINNATENKDKDEEKDDTINNVTENNDKNEEK